MRLLLSVLLSLSLLSCGGGSDTRVIVDVTGVGIDPFEALEVTIAYGSSEETLTETNDGTLLTLPTSFSVNLSDPVDMGTEVMVTVEAVDSGMTIAAGSANGTVLLGENLYLSVELSAPTSCGDGAIDPGEDCDGMNLDGETCLTLSTGFTGGTLACSGTCSFDTTSCEGDSCGDGTCDAIEDCVSCPADCVA